MGDISQMLPLLLLFVVMYFFLIRPGLQKQKKEKKYLEALKAGDKVVKLSLKVDYTVSYLVLMMTVHA